MLESAMILIAAWAVVHGTCMLLERQYKKKQARKDLMQA